MIRELAGLTVGYDGKFLSAGTRFGAHSGQGIHARRLLREMIVCCPQARFRIYSLDSDVGLDPHANCDPVRLPSYARSSFLRNLVAYPIELERRPIDVLLSFSTLPIHAPCSTILLLADVFWLACPGWLPAHLAVPRTLALRNSVKRAHRVVTTTEFSRREIMRLLSVPPHKIVVVPHGVRTELAAPRSDAEVAGMCRRHGIDQPYILSLNDIHPRKNLVGLIDAFERAKLRARLPHQLVVAGRSLWSYPEFYRRASESRVSDDIRILGYVPAGDIRALYQGASLFIYPSFYEGWGLQVHEAMVAGAPVAVSRDTAMSEIAGDAADTFDPYDVDDMSRSIERVVTDPALQDRLVAAGQERVKRYSWRGAAEATLAVCADLHGD